MIKVVKNSFVVVALILSGMSASFAGEPRSESMFGLPSSETVGSLPYSDQWISEKTKSYFYLSFNSAQLASPTMTVGQYVSNFGSVDYGFPSVDFFSHLFSFTGPESRSSARDFAIWGRYSLGAADRSGHMNATQTPINSSVESNSLLVVNARIGAVLGWDRWSWIKPYAGVEVDPYFFRNTSDISGAEQQGEAYCFGPVLGAHFPVMMNGRASLLAEYRRIISVQDSGQIFGNSNNFSTGMGLTF